MLLQTDQAPIADDSAQALIREARRRTRRRWARRLALLAVACGATATVIAVLVGTGPGVIAATAKTPFVNAGAFSGHGELAFISRNRLWVLDGATGTLREMPGRPGYSPTTPEFSHDGRWLAYVLLSNQQEADGPSQLWFAHADGSDAHPIRQLLVNYDMVGWSPTEDVVAVPAGSSAHVPYQSATSLQVVSPDGAREVVASWSAPSEVRTGALENAVWGPDGRELAISTWGEVGTIVRTVSIGPGHHSTVWFAIRNRTPVRGLCPKSCPGNDVIANLEGWSRRWGILTWFLCCGMTRNQDDTNLAVISSAGSPPRLFAQTLSTGLTKAVAPGPGGQLALVSSGNEGRQLSQGKVVEVCRYRGYSCTAVPGGTRWDYSFKQPWPMRGARTPAPGQPGSGVSLDPAWSPNGRWLAYVKAPTEIRAGPPDTWYADHAIYLMSVASGHTRRLGAIDGASLPTWSSDSRSLLYTRDDGLWLMNVATGRSTRIEYPLFFKSYTESILAGTKTVTVPFLQYVPYYGQIPWSQQFAWQS